MAGETLFTFILLGRRNVGMSQVRFPQSRRITTSSFWISLNNKILQTRGTRGQNTNVIQNKWILTWETVTRCRKLASEQQVKKLRFYWMSCCARASDTSRDRHYEAQWQGQTRSSATPHTCNVLLCSQAYECADHQKMILVHLLIEFEIETGNLCSV